MLAAALEASMEDERRRQAKARHAEEQERQKQQNVARHDKAKQDATRRHAAEAAARRAAIRISTSTAPGGASCASGMASAEAPRSFCAPTTVTDRDTKAEAPAKRQRLNLSLNRKAATKHEL